MLITIGYCQARSTFRNHIPVVSHPAKYDSFTGQVGLQYQILNQLPIPTVHMSSQNLINRICYHENNKFTTTATKQLCILYLYIV